MIITQTNRRESNKLTSGPRVGLGWGQKKQGKWANLDQGGHSRAKGSTAVMEEGHSSLRGTEKAEGVEGLQWRQLRGQL